MTGQERSNPLQDARYGIGFSAGLGLFDTTGWQPPPAGEYARFEGGGRRDYGPKGCAGIVLGVTAVLLLAAVFAALAVMGVW